MCCGGPDRACHIRVFAGDIVARKKPDPAIYLLAAQTFNLDPACCVVVEYSNIGLRAAKGAGMACIVTRSTYMMAEDFTIADLVVDDLDAGVDLGTCRRLLTVQPSGSLWRK